MVFGKDILHERDYTRGELAAEIRRHHGWLARFPVLVEEFIVQEPGRDILPTEYKFFMFAGKVGAISVVRRTGRQAHAGYYKENWERFQDAIQTKYPVDEDVHPPHCYDEILAAAKRLGTACGTFIRADFYAAARGGIFGEFSSTPFDGQRFTPFGERCLGDLWDTECTDKI